MAVTVPVNKVRSPRDGRLETVTAIARGSAVECLACLDLLELEPSAPNTTEARAVILRLLNVLTALIRR